MATPRICGRDSHLLGGGCAFSHRYGFRVVLRPFYGFVRRCCAVAKRIRPTVLAYVCFLLHQRLRMFGVFEQAASVFVLVGIHQLIGYWVHGLTGGNYHTLAFLIPALVSALIWPLVRLSLDRLRL